MNADGANMTVFPGTYPADTQDCPDPESVRRTFGGTGEPIC